MEEPVATAKRMELGTFLTPQAAEVGGDGARGCALVSKWS